MRVIVVGLGIQGRKRLAVAGEDAVATADTTVPDASYRSIQEVSLGEYDAALVCTPDSATIDLLTYLLDNGKHVLVEKPLLAENGAALQRLLAISEAKRAVCYTAYN